MGKPTTTMPNTQATITTSLRPYVIVGLAVAAVVATVFTLASLVALGVITHGMIFTVFAPLTTKLAALPVIVSATQWSAQLSLSTTGFLALKISITTLAVGALSTASGVVVASASGLLTVKPPSLFKSKPKNSTDVNQNEKLSFKKQLEAQQKKLTPDPRGKLEKNLISQKPRLQVLEDNNYQHLQKTHEQPSARIELIESDTINLSQALTNINSTSQQTQQYKQPTNQDNLLQSRAVSVSTETESLAQQGNHKTSNEIDGLADTRRSNRRFDTRSPFKTSELQSQKTKLATVQTLENKKSTEKALMNCYENIALLRNQLAINNDQATARELQSRRNRLEIEKTEITEQLLSGLEGTDSIQKQLGFFKERVNMLEIQQANAKTESSRVLPTVAVELRELKTEINNLRDTLRQELESKLAATDGNGSGVSLRDHMLLRNLAMAGSGDDPEDSDSEFSDDDMFGKASQTTSPSKAANEPQAKTQHVDVYNINTSPLDKRPQAHKMLNFVATRTLGVDVPPFIQDDGDWSTEHANEDDNSTIGQDPNAVTSPPFYPLPT